MYSKTYCRIVSMKYFLGHWSVNFRNTLILEIKKKTKKPKTKQSTNSIFLKLMNILKEERDGFNKTGTFKIHCVFQHEI